MKLNAIDAATRLRICVCRHQTAGGFEGERGGQWSIRVNDPWRVCFEWDAGNADQVEIVDYHSGG